MAEDPPATKRNRGLSLRSSLFARNVERDNAQVELQHLPQQSEKQASASVASAPSNVQLPPRTVLPAHKRWLRNQRILPIDQLKRAFQATRKVILRIQDVPPSKDGRHIIVHTGGSTLIDERTGKAYINNFIRSSKYNAWNFLPRQLVFQFSKLANAYFLSVSILQMIPGLSTTGTYTTIVPLMFFVGLSIGKEGYEDLRRHKLDKAENNREAKVLRGDEWIAIKWQDLRVGDVIKLERDDDVPADILLLSSDGDNNTAYIETMALDGETNLKAKQPPASLTGKDATGAHAVVEDPNLNLYNLDGRLTVDDETMPLTNNEVIYRGSVLRNTPSAVGMVIYSGEECKIRMNANKNPRIKAPTLQSTVNRVVIVMVLFVVALSLVCAGAYQGWNNFEDRAWYLSAGGVAFGPLLTSFIIMYNTLIPLSLYVSLEIVKVTQMVLLNDVDMYDEASNTPFEARTSTINEELGQVSYVFSDKTGTLTENVMKFRKLSVAGVAWLHEGDGDGLTTGRRSMARARPSEASAPRRSTTWRPTAGINVGQPELTTEAMIQELQRRPHTIFARKAKMLILSIALCHTCLPERNDGVVTYQAASPDELALVQAAAEMGYIAWDRDAAVLTLHTPVEEKYTILDVIEFSSQRKRMSVVVRFPDNRICVITKGADSVIMKRLRLAALASKKTAEVAARVHERKSMEAQHALRRTSTVSRPSLARLESWAEGNESRVVPDQDAYSPRVSTQSPRVSTHLSGRGSLSIEPRRSTQIDEGPLVDEALVLDDAAVIERCLQHINDFATEGLRTLLYGYRILSEKEYVEWKEVFQAATTSLIDRQGMIERAGEVIERDLELGGATAIEDKLQDGVPETIDRLRRANIKMWMLTGDKRETAINIGHSCRLIKDFSTITVLDAEAGYLAERVLETKHKMQEAVAHSVVVIDGHTLSIVQEDAALKALFLELVTMVDSVICCRASPSQKAALVHSIRSRVKKSVTLAIGDGANDIAMIQEAHVGIGITGKEGLQAARTSDYSIAQFRFLSKLLLVHGRWNYVRTCKYTIGTFWKEIVFYLTQALYQRYNGYTGHSLYESWSLTMFNTLFTSLPIIFLGIFEQDLSPTTLIAVPELYSKGQRGEGFNVRVFLGWAFMGVCEAVIIFYTMQQLFGRMIFSAHGDHALFAMGTLTYTACIVLINVKLQVLEQRYKSVMAIIALVASIGGWFLWNVILSAIYADNTLYGVKMGFLERFGRDVNWWSTLAVAVGACLLFEITVKLIKSMVMPTDQEVFAGLEKDPGMMERFQHEARRVTNRRGEEDERFIAELLTARDALETVPAAPATAPAPKKGMRETSMMI